MKDHKNIVSGVINKELWENPQEIIRMSIWLCSEVYLVKLSNKDVIVRLNKDKIPFLWFERNVKVFKQNNIKIPEIIAKDYSENSFGYYYQILSKIEWEDIDRIINELSNKELKNIAKDLSKIIKSLSNIPTNWKFWFFYDNDSDLLNTWTECMKEWINTIKERWTKTWVLDNDLLNQFTKIMNKYTPYFDSVSSIFYFDDMSSKNVMIHNGTFKWLVDIDWVVYWDHLEAIGRIKASWYWTNYWEYYTNAIMDSLELNKKQREIVVLYAYYNRVYWLCENGIKFNDNTSGVVNWDKADENKKIVNELFFELNNFK